MSWITSKVGNSSGCLCLLVCLGGDNTLEPWGWEVWLEDTPSQLGGGTLTWPGVYKTEVSHTNFPDISRNRIRTWKGLIYIETKLQYNVIWLIFYKYAWYNIYSIWKFKIKINYLLLNMTTCVWAVVNPDISKSSSNPAKQKYLYFYSK